MPTILVVDDESTILELIKYNLEKENYKVLSASDGITGLTMAQAYLPDLIILDIMLPEKDGYEVCRILKADVRTSLIPVIMLSAKDSEIDKVLGLELGAYDYVTKPFSPRQLVARVAALLRRSGAVQRQSVTFGGGALSIDLARREVFRDGEPVPLTPSEWAILTALAGRPGKTFTREELIAVALDDAYEGFDRVVDTHVKNLRQKLERDTRAPRWVVTVYGVGYRFGEQPDA